MEKQTIKHWYETYKTGLYRYALSILKNPQSAEDVLQEAFLRLLSGKYVVAEEKIQAWLYRVVRNCCYDLLRSREWNAEPLREIPSYDGEFAYIERISVLELKDREIVTLKILGGMTSREIGKVLGMSESAIQKRYQRAIQKLREQEDSHGE